MDFSRRRFLGIATMVVGSTFIPASYASEVVMAERDRFSLLAGAFKKAIDVLPQEYLGDPRLGTEILSWRAENQERRDAFDRLFDEALEFGLKEFPEMPTSQEVLEMLKNSSTDQLAITDTSALSSTSAQLVVVSSMRSCILRRLPITTRGATFDTFAKRYHTAFLYEL